MNRLEEELTKALRRVEPPAGFAERVLVRAATRKQREKAEARSWFSWLGGAGLRWATACAVCAALAASGIAYRHEQHKRGEQAKAQLMLALRITSSKLQIATENVRQLSGPQP